LIEGLSGHEFDGVFFTEQSIIGVPSLKKCSAVSNVQNTHIDKLKAQLAQQARAVGANAIVNFTYAQRANFFSFSSVSWEASGDAVRLPGQTDTGATKACGSCGGPLSAAARFCRACGSPVN
jgi:hypothetical protein